MKFDQEEEPLFESASDFQNNVSARQTEGKRLVDDILGSVDWTTGGTTSQNYQ